MIALSRIHDTLRGRPKSVVLVVAAALILVLVAAEMLRGGTGNQSRGLPDPHPAPAVAQINDEFTKHSIVAIGEIHDLQEAGDFYRTLLQRRTFLAKADAVVVEFGNARYQSVIDAFVNGQNVAPARLRRVWQDTTQVGAWDAPIYEAFFAAVRKANAQRPSTRRIRVLLGDPPIEWSSIHSQRQWQSIAKRRERFMARVIERDVLAKGGKALVIAGLAHVTHGGGGVSDLIEAHHPGSVFVAAVHVGFPTEALEQRLASWRAPALADVSGTWIGDLGYGDHLTQDALDGLLYLGSLTSLHLSVPLPTVYRDNRYWAELRRRFKLANGSPFSASALFTSYSSPPYPSDFDPEDIARQQRFSACMRDHGVQAFPDPQVQFDSVGSFGESIKQAQKDPDFRQGQRVCAKRILGLAPPGG